MIRRVIDVVETYKGTQSVEEMSFLGETEKNISGYSLAVRAVRLNHSGLRVRLEVMREGVAYRHLDTTTELVSRAIPFLLQAAALGGPVESLQEITDWWATCTVQQFKDRVALMKLEEAETLLSELKAAASLAEQAVRLSGCASQDVARASVLHAKRKAVKQCVHRLLQVNRSSISVKELGKILLERFGSEVTDSIFAEARGKKPSAEGV